MADTQFIAVLPTTTQPGDKIIIKGTLVENPNQFSINFVNQTCRAPTDITYHMKWIVNENKLVENYKVNGDWIDHKESYINSLDGNQFALEFIFQEDINEVQNIYVYGISEYGSPLISSYELSGDFQFSNIESLQVWGDVAKVNQLSFIYN